MTFFIIIFKQSICSFFFFFNDTATTEIYTLSLHDALPIYKSKVDGKSDGRLAATPSRHRCQAGEPGQDEEHGTARCPSDDGDRKSTRLNSSHTVISYAVFCLKKKKITNGKYLLKSHTEITS